MSKTEQSDYRLLLSGDLHVGRSSSNAAWERLVQLAITERVNAVLLAGDLVDEENPYWESLGAFEDGLQLLADNGIKSIAVAGGHDLELLGRLTNQLTWLGAGEKWERITLETERGPVLHVDGWSPGSRSVEKSPLDDYENSSTDMPVLGLLHGNWEPAASVAWLMGGAHQPVLEEEDPWVLCPGSPQAMGPVEAGVHGPWIAEIRNGKIGLPTQKPLSSVWYETAEIDATGIVAEEDLRSEIKDALQIHGERIVGEAGAVLEQIVMHLRIRGQSNLAGEVSETLEQIERDFRMHLGTVTMTVDQARSELLPDIDLEKHAGQNSILGTVASLLLELDRDQRSEAVEELIEETRQELAQVGARPSFIGLPSHSMGVDEVVDHLRRSGRDLLVQLLKQNHA